MSRQLQFDWDEAKATSNARKHGVPFILATTAFRDPSLVTIFDEDHSNGEERWVSIRLAAHGFLLVVVYQWTEVDQSHVKVRIIPARSPNKHEQRVYKEEQ